MKLLHLSTAAVVLLLASCSSTVQTRVQKNPEKFQNLPASDQELVSQGKIREGMSKDAVFIAMGNPSGITRGSENKRSYEAWRYNGYRPIHTNTIGLSFGSGYGRYRRGCSGYALDYHPEVHYVPYTAAVVKFTGDRVSSWESVR